MIYTSRYFNPELQQNPDKYAVVRISVGTPRFLKYKPVASIKELAPVGFHTLTDRRVFRERYIERLEYFGIEPIAARLADLQATGKPVVLCCYEDIRKGGENWCHRSMFADWFYEKTGVFIEELPDPSPFKLELSNSPFADLLAEFF